MFRDAVRPDVTIFTNYEITGAGVIRITVSQGTNKPYYLSEKGLKPSGVYVRQGTSAAPASPELIRQMIRDTDGDKFESRRSVNQDLHFSCLKKEFKKRNLKLGDNQMKTLKIKNADGIYTNTGLLLSDECPHTIKVAVFAGTDKGVFKDRREFAGSLLKQLRDSYEYLDLFNKLKATFSGLERIEERDYPESAIREALINAIVHREYAFSGSILISIFDDRIEIVSLGGLVSGLGYDDIMLGISQCRNENLAGVFYRLKYIEAYGTGIQQILSSYNGYKRKPVFKITSGAFLAELPNRNFACQGAVL